MPARRFTVPLDTIAPQEVTGVGTDALSVVVTECTAGVVFELRMGSNGDWLGPFEGQGRFPMTFSFGAGLPASDLNRGIYVRAPVAVPGASLVLNVSTGGGE